MSQRATEPRVVRTHPGLNLAGLVLLGVASLGAAAGVAVALVAREPNGWRLLAAAGGLAAAGLWARLTGQRLRLDWRARRLTARRQTLAFAELAHVELRAVTVERELAHETRSLVRYQVVLARAADGEQAARVAGMRRRLDAAATDDRTALDTAAQASLAGEAERLRPARSGDALVAFEHDDELRLWRAAEAVAKALDLPVIDFAGDTVVIRTPAELDLPLGQRLRRLHVPLTDPGSPPEGIAVSRTADGERFTWRFAVWPPVVGLSLTAGLLGVAAWVTWVDYWDVGLGFAGLSGVLLAWAGRLALGARRSLIVGRTFVTYRPGMWPRRALRIPVTELELVRLSRAHPDTLGLVSDRRLVRVRLPVAAADWLRRRLELLLREQGA